MFIQKDQKYQDKLVVIIDLESCMYTVMYTIRYTIISTTLPRPQIVKHSH